MNTEVKTGDLVLCDDLEYGSWGLFSWFIKFMMKSDFSHIGMIVTDPEFTNPPLKGTYVWMSGTSNVPDAEDGKQKFGGQFVPYDEFVSTYGGFGQVCAARARKQENHQGWPRTEVKWCKYDDFEIIFAMDELW